MTEQHADSPPAALATGGSSKGRLVVIAVTLTAAVIGAAILFTQVGKDDSTTNAVTSTLRLDGYPNGLAAGADGLWVALNDEPATGLDAKLARLNLTSGAVEKSLPLSGMLSFTSKIGDSLWITHHRDWWGKKPSELLELDWRSGKTLRRIPFEVGARPGGFAFAGDDLWVTVARGPDGPTALVRIDPTTNTAVGEPVALTSRNVTDVKYGEGALWAAAFEDGRLLRIDPATSQVDVVDVGDEPVGIAVTEGAVWVTNRASGTVDRVDPSTLTVTDTIDVGATPSWLTVAGDALWVSNETAGTVTRIDPVTRTVVGSPIKIAAAADDAAAHVSAASGASLWVASRSEETVSRIDATR